MKTGCPMTIITKVPHQKQLSKICTDLSEEAKFRLRVIDYYNNESAMFSKRHKPDVTLTCKMFNIHRSLFYYWYARYDSKNLKSLENSSTTPKNRRHVQYDYRLVEEIRRLRKEYPCFSALKIKAILDRDCTDMKIPSRATIGRIIKRYDLYYRYDLKSHKRASLSAKKAHRERLKYNLTTDKPNSIIELDMKHINLPNGKLYALCGIDICTKMAVVHICSSPSSRNNVEAIKKIVAKFGKDITIVNDNGSENMGEAEAFLKEAEAFLKKENIKQLWTRVRKPKDKPHIERFIGTLQREFLDFHYEPLNCQELQEKVEDWLFDYEYFRPHLSLGLLTPAEYSDKLEKANHIVNDVSEM